MTLIDWVLLAGLLIVATNALVCWRNLRRFGVFPVVDSEPEGVRLTVCIPARNEAGNIAACVERALAGAPEWVGVLVYDDGSTDGTGDIVRELGERDGRVRLAERCELPSGWNGKQHGLWRCAIEAFGLGDERGGTEPATHCLFIDADVRLERGAIVRAAGLFGALDQRVKDGRVKGAKGFGVLSCFPRQETGTLAESAVVPLIFFLLLSYLPFGRMRSTNSPSASAGCGQFLLVSREAYEAFGGHEAFRETMHDGIKMPRAARRAGYHTDVYDGSDAASVRMYTGFGEVWRGFAKNAYEGLGSVPLLVFLTVVHFVGHVLPALLVMAMLAVSLIGGEAPPALAYLLGLVVWTVPVVQRVMVADRLGHAALGALVHPLGIGVMIGVQWWSFYLHVTGKRSWRGRDASGAEVAAA